MGLHGVPGCSYRQSRSTLWIVPVLVPSVLKGTALLIGSKWLLWPAFGFPPAPASPHPLPPTPDAPPAPPIPSRPASHPPPAHRPHPPTPSPPARPPPIDSIRDITGSENI